MMTPSYGMAEATVYVATAATGGAPVVVDFEPREAGRGHRRAVRERGWQPADQLRRAGIADVRIVDPDTRRANVPRGTVGEIWVHGENVASGYWNKPEETERTFGGQLVDPSPGTPEGPWLRTGDLGFISEDELFIVGRIKDLLIVYGRNHYPEDIEATVQEITRGRVAAISVPMDHTEKLVTIIELKKRGDSDEEAMHKLSSSRTTSRRQYQSRTA